MKLVKFKIDRQPVRVGIWEANRIHPLQLDPDVGSTLADLLEQPDVRSVIELSRRESSSIPIDGVQLLAPIDRQEVWAAGVTYRRSQAARMEESEAAADCYDRVYRSPRPELFFKATPHRVAGPGEAVRVRYDSTWSVPEPEITLVLNSQLKLVGFTVGNDMSARDIEGENPLYLPQAKVYSGCCALGPCITLADAMPSLEETLIRLVIRRGGEVVFEGETSLDALARTFAELIDWLSRENVFPHGVFLLTGTGIVPPNDFTLRDQDEVSITIDGIGTLTNPVVQSQTAH